MFIGDDYAEVWLDRKGNSTHIKDMGDKHLMSSLFYVEKLCREAYENVSITESIANNAPYYLRYKPEWHLLLPSYYYNAKAELTKRGLYK